MNLDYRDDLGYGRTSAKYHEPRVKASSYPYIEYDEYDDIDDLGLEIDVLQRIINKVSTPYKSDDSLIGRSADHNAKVDGNKPILALGEITAANGLVPFPAMYKKRIQVGGGVGGGSMQYVRGDAKPKTGSWLGWAHPPAEMGPPDSNITFDEYINDEEDANILKLRKVVRGILDQQE
jgi:hypothetical protein